MFISGKALLAFLQIDIKHLMECLQTLNVNLFVGSIELQLNFFLKRFGSFDFCYLRHSPQKVSFVFLLGSFSLQAQHTNTTIIGQFKA